MPSARGVARGYFVEQAFGLLFFFVLSILFLFQLVMQRRAKYDERQLTQRQRVEDWKKVAAPAKRQHRQSSVSRMIDQHNASAPGSKRNSVDGALSPTLRDHRSISMPSQDGGISAPETPHGAYSPRESSSVSNDTFSSNPSTDGTDSAEQAPPKSKQEAPQTRGSGTWNKQPQRGSLHYNVPIAEHPTAEREKRPRVGMVQIVLHRIGFAASVLKVIHFVDPHSALGVFPFSVTIQIAYMVNGLLFVCAIFAFLYPLHLIRVLSLNNRSRTIFFVGVTLSVLTIIVCFFVPIAYHFVGPLNYLRAIIFLWLMFATIAITVVLDIYSPRLIASLEKLITFHSKGPGKVARFQGTASNNNLLSNASTNPSSPADSPVASPTHQSRSLIQADTVSDSTAPLALTRSASSSESVAQRHSLLPQSVQGPAVALVNPLGDSASATVESRLDINSSSAELAAEDNENYRSRGSDASPSGSPLPLIQHNAKSSSCDNLDNIRSEDSSPNQSAQNTPTMTFASLKTHVNVPPLSLSKLGRSAGEQKSNYSQPNHRHVQTSLVQYTVSEAVVSIHDPSIPSIPEVAPPPASAPVSAANKGYKVGQRRSVSRSMSESRKRRAAKNPVIRQYKKLIERMRLFQICANVIMVLLLIGLLIGLTGQLKDPRAVAAAPSRSNFLEAITYTIYDVVLFLGLSLALWFAYIPGSCSQFGCSRLPKCMKALDCLRKIRKAAPAQRDERRLSFHSVSPPPPGGRALGNESPVVQLAVQQ